MITQFDKYFPIFLCLYMHSACIQHSDITDVIQSHRKMSWIGEYFMLIFVEVTYCQEFLLHAVKCCFPLCLSVTVYVWFIARGLHAITWHSPWRHLAGWHLVSWLSIHAWHALRSIPCLWHTHSWTGCDHQLWLIWKWDCMLNVNYNQCLYIHFL